jgi:energy-coupling factor transporter ATP-binding protein EcfA2
MIITSLKIEGWRSFCPGHPIALESLGPVNLLIGPNNVGKSNVGRFLVRLRDCLKKFRGVNVWGDGSDYSGPLNVQFEIEEADSWLRYDLEVVAELGIPVSAINAPVEFGNLFHVDGCFRFQIKMRQMNGAGHLSINPFSSDNRPFFFDDNGTVKLLLDEGAYTEQITSAHKHRYLALACCALLADSIIDIRPLRDPSRPSLLDFGDTTDGGEIVAQLQKEQDNPNRKGFWTRYQKDLEEWFGRLLGEDNLRLAVTQSGIVLQVMRGKEPFQCLLQDLGAGVSEILSILAYLRLKPSRQFLVVIDEPEAHLHPSAVVELSKLMAKNLPSHQLLITTHSTALVDAVEPLWATFRVRRAEHSGTLVEKLFTTPVELSLLADLGIRPSQLFLPRASVWVEGPSDIPYWTGLIREVSPELVVGRDFAFVTYGGASAAHLGFSDDDEDLLVRVLRISHRAVIICDADDADPLFDRPLIDRLKQAAVALPDHATVVKSVGREVENCVCPDVLKRVIDSIRPTRFNKPARQLSYVDYSIGDGQAFDVVVSKAARTATGDLLTQDDEARVCARLTAKKHEIAKRILELSLTEKVFKEEAVKRARDLVKWLSKNPGE